jgi:dihydroorotate dehydrogenase electron transfer subunit
MPMTHASARYVTAEVHWNAPVGADYWLMDLRVPPELGAQDILPGQFVMLKGPIGLDPLLRRPFSVLEKSAGRIELLNQVVGRATRGLASLRPGAIVQVLGPLGRPFPEPEPGRHDLLVGGGSGIPPLHLQARRAVRAELGETVEVIYGGRTAEHLVLLPRLRSLGVSVVACTDDGSVGERGLVTDVLAPRLGGNPRQRVLACGPRAMLRAVQALCRERGVVAYLSLETEMACGLGICRGCAVPKPAGGYLCTCVEGPVVSADEVTL